MILQWLRVLISTVLMGTHSPGVHASFHGGFCNWDDNSGYSSLFLYRNPFLLTVKTNVEALKQTATTQGQKEMRLMDLNHSKTAGSSLSALSTVIINYSRTRS